VIQVRRMFGVLFVVAMLSVGLAVNSFASFDYSNTFAGVSTELTTALTAIVPLVVVVFALIMGIRLGLRLFRSVIGR